MRLERFWRRKAAEGRARRHGQRAYDVINPGHFAPDLCRRAEAALGYDPAHHTIHTLMLSYRDGDFALPHLDHPSGVLRLNAVVLQADAGGEFRVRGQAVPLEAGDAVIFRPASERHELTRVSGERVIWSLGLVPR